MATPTFSDLHVGISRRNITPELGTPLFGYGKERLASAVADDLHATALVLKSSACTACILSLDLCLIEESDIASIRGEVEAATGIPAANVTVTATHTHSGPITVTAWGWGQKNHKYLDFLKPRVLEAVVEAHQNSQPAQEGIGTSRTQVGINRREVELGGNVRLGFNEWGPRDDQVTVVTFEGTDGLITALVHLTAHPTARGLDPEISRDWTGIMLDRVEQSLGVPVLFINGSFGDVAPRIFLAGATCTGVQASFDVGHQAAVDVLATARGIKEHRPVDLETIAGTFAMPYLPLATRDEALSALRTLGDTSKATGMLEAEWYHWNAVLEAHQTEVKTHRTWHQTLTRLGPIVIVPFAGEVFSEIALRLKKASPYAHTLCAGASNGSHGYYVTREARARGGYEPLVAKAYGAYIFAENIDDVLVQENLKLIHTLHENSGH